MGEPNRFAEIDATIDAMDERLRRIALQNAQLAEMVEVLGGFVNATVETLQEHGSDEHGGTPDR